MSGKIIVFEGLDGSGKATQSQRLYESLKNSDKKILKLSFPDYASDSSTLVKMYLNGEFGSSPDSVNPYAASSFYAVDRYASYAKNWKQFYSDGGIIIADRYTTSNAIHQCAKMPQDQWDNFIQWLFHYEYELLGIPAPDMVIYLRVDPKVSQNLMTKRYNGNEKRKDIHESDFDYLKRSMLAADYCSDLLNWNIIECVRDGEIRKIEDITQDIMCLIGKISCNPIM